MCADLINSLGRDDRCEEMWSRVVKRNSFQACSNLEMRITLSSRAKKIVPPGGTIFTVEGPAVCRRCICYKRKAGPSTRKV